MSAELERIHRRGGRRAPDRRGLPERARLFEQMTKRDDLR